jgi:hypothetical protein
MTNRFLFLLNMAGFRGYVRKSFIEKHELGDIVERMQRGELGGYTDDGRRFRLTVKGKKKLFWYKYEMEWTELDHEAPEERDVSTTREGNVISITRGAKTARAGQKLKFGPPPDEIY